MRKPKTKGKSQENNPKSFRGKRTEKREDSKSNRSFRSRPKRNGGGGRSSGGRSGGGSRFKKQQLDPNTLINKTLTQTEKKEVVTRSFASLPLHAKLQSRLKVKKFVNTTEIQDKTIEMILEGENIMGIANTGTGKTGAFLIPIIERLLYNKKKNKSIVLVPTRELAQQVETEFKSLTKGLQIYSHCLIGGTNINKDVSKLRREAHIIIGTPGRVNDMLNRRALKLFDTTNLVLDEFDTMLDMGFQQEVLKIVDQMPNRQQTILFSATQTEKQKSVIQTLMPEYEKVRVSQGESNTDNIYQDVIRVESPEEKNQILQELLQRKEYRKVLIFLDTKRQVTRLYRQLKKNDFRVDEIHGDKSQNYRSKAIQNFKSGKIQVMVATDVASRGIDIDNISLVVNYHIPGSRESYVHRIGRTGRAGKEGHAITFVQKSGSQSAKPRQTKPSS
ncbi:MAG: DEAD/DEAH box helicase [Flavobacteriaceae bacterium]|jgi:ATP-dependent RNA helicase RhlE|nr:DEAD/DEAH box helicase [Flavobacteriales bacterium]MDG1272818.1 DEAD/DEAH box helicase [Flavobacteriaceae bacterium]